MKRWTILCLLFATMAHAEDAPQFRGAGGLGTSSEKNLPTVWSDTENIRWKASLPGRGLSNPVISGGRVYVTAASRPDQNRLHVLCFDQKDGKLLWERQFWATGGTQCHPKTNMAAPTPIAVDGKIFALFATADLFCLDKDGDLLWARSLVGDYPTVGNNVGMAASPVYVDGTLIVHMENVGESFAVGIDPETGKNRWRLDRPRLINWNTPFVHNPDGRAQVLLMTPKELTAHEVGSGKKLWSFPSGKLSTISSVIAGEGLVFVPADKFTAIRPASDGGEPQVVWQNAKLNTGYASPVLVKGRLYNVTNSGIVNCADAQTGKVVWTHRLEGPFAASPMAAENRIYFVNEAGVTSVMEAGDEPKVLATNEVKGGPIMACPVASGGMIFLRSDANLWAIGKK